ncbi:MAG: cytochrome o ubiquinol oxidase subunit IV [Steroidobacteraceae bacterium]
MSSGVTTGNTMSVHFSLRTYVTGFFVAAVLTAIPFWIAMTGAITSTAIATALIVMLAVAQIIVHTVAFLHLNARSEDGWTLMAYVFTAVLLLITIAGSVWIMNHLNSNMMPGMMSDPQATAESP